MAIISFSKGFIFLKTRKVAGTSVEALMRPHLGAEDIIPAVTPRDEFYCASRGAPSRNYLTRPEDESRYTNLVLDGHFDEAASFLGSCKKRASSHMSYSQIKGLLDKRGHSIEEFFVFTIDRHPYDWLLSTILYDNSAYNRTGDGLSKTNRTDLDGAAEMYLRRPGVKNKINWAMYAHNDQVIVDRVLRYENLRAELLYTIARFIPECDINDLPKLKQNNSDMDGHSVFSSEVKGLAKQIFAPMLRYFDYAT